MQDKTLFSDIKMFVTGTNKEIVDEYSKYLDRFSDKENTIKERKKSVRYFLIFMNRNKLLLRYIETSDLDKFVIFLREGQYKNNRDRTLSPGSLRQIIALLKTFFLWCYENKFIETHPDRIFTSDFRKRLPKVPRKVHDYFSFKQIQKFLDSANNHKKALLYVLYNTMGRVGTVVNVKIKDFDYNRRVLILRESKNDIELEAVLSDATAHHLQEYLLKFRPNVDSEYIFISRIGVPMSVRAVQHYVKTHSLKILGKKLTPHSLRHMGITHMIESGAEISEVQRIVGHRSIQTTAGYKASNPRFRRKVMKETHPLMQLENTKIRQKKVRDTISRTKTEIKQAQKQLEKIIAQAQYELDDMLQE
jgi:integrase/recombinase XerD